MSRETQLAPGQVNIAAKPVDAFITPVNYQVGQPGQLAEMPGVRGFETIGTAGSPMVQGRNNIADLADALRPFSKAVMETATAAGLAYAGWQMDKGEAEFMAAYRQAQLKVDESTEVGENQYAQGTRAVGAKDLAAGMTMWGLNPYRQIGAQRARSRLAGQEISGGMSGYVNSQSHRIDYESPDQGFGALQSIRAEYIAQVTEKWGVNDSSPGFQKYAAPAIERASEKEATRLQEDRVKYFDEMKPKQLAELLRNEAELLSKTRPPVELGGNVYTYTPNGDNELYWLAARKRLNNMARDFLQKAGPGGMASKWQREAFEILYAEADFRGDTFTRTLIGQISSSEPLRGPDGKPVKGPDGGDVYLTWGQLYSKETVDSQIKYEQAGYSMNAARAKDFRARAEGAVANVIQGMPPGPARYQAAVAAFNRFVAQEESAGRRPDDRQLNEARKGIKEAMDATSDLLFEQDDPYAASAYYTRLNTLFGTNFNAAQERAMIDRVSLNILDPGKRQEFVTRANAMVDSRAKEVQDMSGYTSARDKVIGDNINARLERNYPRSANPNRGKPDREESERRQRLAYTTHVNERIREKEAQLGRKLTETEVRSVAQQAIDEYGKNNKDAVEYLFPGSMAYPDSPSVDPYQTIKPVDLGPDGKPKPNGGVPIPKVYDINQFDAIPNRAVELRQYRTKPVMSLQSIRDVMFNAIEGKPQNMKFERAWRDSGAPNGYDFIERQLQFYPNYGGGDWSEDELLKAKKRLLSMAGTSNAEVAAATLQTTYPNLAVISGWRG